MILKAPAETIVILLGHNVYQLVEKLLVKKWSDFEIAEDLEFIKEELGKSLVNLT
jgi:V-type H+-transporting ATPase subunit H